MVVSSNAVDELSQGTVHIKAGAPAVGAFLKPEVRLPRRMRSNINKDNMEWETDFAIRETV